MKVIVIIAALLLVLFSGFAHAQVEHQTFQNSLGQNVGRSVTNSRGNTVYYDRMGQNTGRSVTTGNGTTFYNSKGQQTGTSRGRK